MPNTKPSPLSAEVIETPRWLLLVLVGLVVVLIVLLWSAQRGRRVHLTIGKIDTLREALPSIVGPRTAHSSPGNR